MRKLSLLIAAATVALLAPAEAAVAPALPKLPPLGAAEAPLFAAGGTHVSNGIFFPGTALCAGSYCAGEPYAIDRGSDIRFYNLDPAALANNHRIISKATRKNGAPLFFSESVAGPGSTLMKTSHLKPGVYPFYCPIHGGMDGILEITE